MRCTRLAALALCALGCTQVGVVGNRAADGGSDALGAPMAVQECRNAVFALSSAGCITEVDFSRYYQRCSAVDEPTLGRFNTCARQAGCPGETCYGLLGPTHDIGRCQTGCGFLLDFGCLSAADNTACQALCVTATSASADSFANCSDRLCAVPGCYEAFRAANGG